MKCIKRVTQGRKQEHKTALAVTRQRNKRLSRKCLQEIHCQELSAFLKLKQYKQRDMRRVQMKSGQKEKTKFKTYNVLQIHIVLKEWPISPTYSHNSGSQLCIVRGLCKLVPFEKLSFLETQNIYIKKKNLIVHKTMFK